MLFLRPQICPIQRGQLYHHPGPSLCRPLHTMCALELGPCDGRCQGLLRPMGAPPPNRSPSLLEVVRVVCHPELHLAPERFDKVSCDDTGRRPVFREHHLRVR